MNKPAPVVGVATFVLLGIFAFMIADWSAAEAEGPTAHTTVRDPISGDVADGTVRALSGVPSVIEHAGETPITIFQITALDNPETTLLPRVIAFVDGIVDAQSRERGDDVVVGDTLDSGLFKNPGPYTLEVKYTADGELKSMHLAPGFGFIVGADLTPIAATHTWGCRCVCTSSTNGGEPYYEYITLDCIVDPGVQTFPPDCQCELYNEQICTMDNDQITGRTSACLRSLIKNN